MADTSRSAGGTTSFKVWADQAVLRRLFGNRFVARWWRFWAQFVLRVRKPLIIGVTGSAGKTTTVNMIASVLAHSSAHQSLGLVGQTVKNMNDDAAVPLTVLRYDYRPNRLQTLAAILWLPIRALRLAFIERYPNVLVLEFGTHSQGHLHRLVALAPPNIGVVTNIGPAHLDRLKTLQGVVHEKGAIVSAVPASGLVVLGAEHDHVRELELLAKGRVVKLHGRGIALSREIARTVALHLGLSEQAIASALADFRPAKGRLNLLRFDELSVIDDSYNANPLSMRLGLDSLSELANPGQRCLAFLGSMGELGEDTVAYHKQIGAYAREKADVVIGVGELGKNYCPDRWFADSKDCAAHLNELLRPGDCLLVKGSASGRMSVIVDRLRATSREVA